VLTALALLANAAAAAAHSGGRDDDRPDPDFGSLRGLAIAAAATARYHRLETAQAAGYGLLKDAAGISCIDNPGTGGMGVHYVKEALVGDPAIGAARPEALVYEPERNGRLRLVALEHVVLQAAWDAAHSAPPSLFGQQFSLVPAGNRYGLPAFYELHAWVGKHNPSGLFKDWNPRVHCPAA
jgi:hypothetical protein